MPILEYRCESCEKKAEFLVLAGDRGMAPVCPTCGDGPCAMPGMCGPSACGFGEN
jgi:putative FmdB family regulatory protein